MLPVLRLPRVPLAPPGAAPRTREPWPGLTEPRTEIQRLRALIVEDQPADIELMQRALRESGFDVQSDCVQDEEAFREAVQKNSYDIVLADYNLPQWNGMEAVAVLRQEGLDIPVILVTGALGEVKAVECLKEGAADYVLKDHLPRLPGSVQRAVQEKKLREANKRGQEDLARSNQELEQFAYVASHDLQEPLRMIATYTQLLAERYRGQLDENAEKYISYVVEGATRMQALIEGLLAFSRVGRPGIEPQNTDCNTVTDIACKNLERAIQESGARIEHERLPVIVADTRLFVQLFQNLIGNAIKFRGKDAPAVRISAEKQNQEWTFVVADNGIGIAPEHAKAVFQIFKRLHTHTEYPGSGIGLSICQKIVEQHGGRIWVESAPGRGAAFKFVVPCLRARNPLGGA